MLKITKLCSAGSAVQQKQPKRWVVDDSFGPYLEASGRRSIGIRRDPPLRRSLRDE
jgi:hypothetical protein